MRRLNTVRAGYLYITGGSLLLSGGILLALQAAAAFVYGRHTADSGFLLIRLLRWMINHIGRLPLAVIIFSTAAAGFFLLRSQPLSDDFKAVVRASDELALTGSINGLKVSTGGELGRLAANLQEISTRKQVILGNMSGTETAYSSEATDLSSEESMALILRIKTLLRLLEDLEVEEVTFDQVEAAKREAVNLMEFVERRIGQS